MTQPDEMAGHYDEGMLDVGDGNQVVPVVAWAIEELGAPPLPGLLWACGRRQPGGNLARTHEGKPGLPLGRNRLPLPAAQA